MARSGVRPLGAEEGLALLDASLAGTGRALLVPAGLDVRALVRAGGGEVPGLLRSLVRGPVRRAAAAHGGTGGDAGGLAARLAALPASERLRAVLEIVNRQVAAVLGFTEQHTVSSDKPFKEFGFDSLTAVEFRNSLGAETGVRLPATLVFDYPTPQELAAFLLDEVLPTADSGDGTGGAAYEESVRASLLSIPLARLRDSGLLDTLLELAGHKPGDAGPEAPEDGAAGASESIDAMDAESLIEMALADSDF
nr:beta-ketoacyl reductase [Streptomyces olivoverticillatus]